MNGFRLLMVVISVYRVSRFALRLIAVGMKRKGYVGQLYCYLLLYRHFSVFTRRFTLIGVCLDEQVVDEVPREAHDATVDMCALLLQLRPPWLHLMGCKNSTVFQDCNAILVDTLQLNHDLCRSK